MIKLHYGGEDHYFHETDILTPGKHYQKMCNITSDINEHLPTLKKYTEMCEKVTEMGVRFACSTWAFLEGRPKKITCYDINYDFFEPSSELLKKMSESYNIQFEFITGDSLKLEIEKTDLLFIDTLHTYNQLYSELILHHKNVNKYIILHDTTTFADIDEPLYEHASDEIKNKDIIKSGLNLAISDFLIENKELSIKEVFTNNNGLTVLSKSN